MIYSKTNPRNQFHFLPFLCGCSEKKWKETVERNARFSTLDEFQTKILQLILSNENWTKSRYTSFKVTISRMKDKDIGCCASTIYKILLLSDEELIEELKKFTTLEQNFYPFTEKKKDKETGKYIAQTKKIDVNDSFILASEITKKIHSYVSSLSHKIMNEQDNPYATLDILIEILEERDIQNKERLLNYFDRQFGYLKESDLYKDIFYEYRENFLDIFLKAIAFHIANVRTGTKENLDAYLYIKTKRAERE